MSTAGKKKRKCIECESTRKRLHTYVTPFGNVSTCKECFSKVFTISIGEPT